MTATFRTSKRASAVEFTKIKTEGILKQQEVVCMAAHVLIVKRGVSINQKDECRLMITIFLTPAK